jgi:hypothetical protein
LRRDDVRRQFGDHVLAEAENVVGVVDRLTLLHEPDAVDRFLVRLDAALADSFPGLSADAIAAMHWFVQFSFR